MKVNIDIDCTPEEARTFFGLPDVQPLQQAMLQQMQTKVEEGLDADDMEKLFRFWTTGASVGFQEMQKAMWSFAGGQGSGDK